MPEAISDDEATTPLRPRTGVLPAALELIEPSSSTVAMIDTTKLRIPGVNIFRLSHGIDDFR
jgi:hypothetical protein